MNLVGYTATALSRNDIEDTPTNKNVVDFAIVELKDLQGNLVTIYDDEEGTNPETQKTCDTNGQVTFFAEIGDYNLEINGKSQRINLAANIADYIKLGTGESVQEFANSFALKIFQSPTDGGLTEIQTRTVDANEVYEVRKTSDDSLATIYSDAAGTTEIVQNGTNNVSGSDGVVEFYITDGDYYIEVGGAGSIFTTQKPVTNFNNIEDATSYPRVKELLGSSVWIFERSSNFKVVETSTVTPNGMDAFQSDFNSFYSFQVVEITAKSIGASIEYADNSTYLNRYAELCEQFGADFITEEPYKILESVYVPSGVNVENKKALDATNATSLSLGAALVIGSDSMTNLTTLSSDAIKGEMVISVGSAVGISVGDVLSIYNPVDFSYHKERDYYRDGELVMVSSVSGNDLTITKPLSDTFLSSDMEVWRMDSPNKAGLNINVDCSNIDAFAVQINGAALSSGSLSGSGGNWGVYDRSMCFDCDWRISTIKQTDSSTTLAYGIANRNSSYQRDHGGSVEAMRHAVTNTGRGGEARPPSRGNRSYNQSLTNHPEVTNTSAWDCHAIAENCLAINCDIYGGVVIGGANNGTPNCRLYQLGTRVLIKEGALANTNVNFSGCELHLTNVVTASAAAASFGSLSGEMDVNLNSGGIMNFSGCKIYIGDEDNVTSKSLIDITIRGYSGGDVDVDLSGVKIYCPEIIQNTNIIQIERNSTNRVRMVSIDGAYSEGVSWLLDVENLSINGFKSLRGDQTVGSVQAFAAEVTTKAEVSNYFSDGSKYQGLSISSTNSATVSISNINVSNCNQLTSTNSRARSGVSVEGCGDVYASGINSHTGTGLADSYPINFRDNGDVYLGVNSYSGFSDVIQQSGNTSFSTMNLGIPI